MASLVLAKRPAGSVQIELCKSCQLFWFDALESVQLAPNAVLALFETIHAAPQPHGSPLPEHLVCPRCLASLSFTHDRVREQKFVYYRCGRGHGRLIAFFQWLREKSFVRPIPAEELARLRALVRIIRCSACGAPVDLERDSACTYCRAPITVLDPASVQKALEGLRTAASGEPTTVEGRRTADILPANAWIDSLKRDDDDSLGIDLVWLGVEALRVLAHRS